MKRMITSLMAVVLLLTALTIPAFAADVDPSDTENVTEQTCCSCFVDADNDGICDHRKQNNGRRNHPGFIDLDGDGLCDRANHGNHQNGMPCFADADGDGICDHWNRGRGRGWAFGLLRQIAAGKPCPCCRGNGQLRSQQNNRPDATPPGQDSECVCANQNGNFVDEDNDGVCDNRNDNFVDENNDSVCDNRGEDACPGNGNGQGKGHGNGNGHGRCRGRN